MTADLPPLSLGPLRPLASADAASGFRCEHEALNRFFRQEAGQQGRRDVNRTWVLRRPEDRSDLPLVLGYYTLAIVQIERSSLPSPGTKRLARYPIPGVLIGRLARDDRCKGLGIGERLLDDAHRRALAINDQIGCVLAVVDAKDERAAAFYRRFDYQPLVASEVDRGKWPQRYYVKMSTLRASYASTPAK